MPATYKQRHASLVQALLLTTMFAGAYCMKLSEIKTAPQVEPIAAFDSYAGMGDYPFSDSNDIDLPDFSSIRDVRVKKQTFFDFLQPYIDAKNAQVRRERRVLQAIASRLQLGMKLRPDESRFLRQLSQSYELETDDVQSPEFIALLLRRVDVLPPSLVLAQAANESGWGTSRFAQQGNNLFGQWCYEQGCGLVPVSRHSSASHEVKSFTSVEESVNAYFQNLNTFPSYQDMRVIRQALRQNAKPIDGISLTQGLGKYSERGEAYIQDLQTMIYKNNLLSRDRTLYP